jgi:hypothetical protein
MREECDGECNKRLKFGFSKFREYKNVDIKITVLLSVRVSTLLKLQYNTLYIALFSVREG